MANYKGIISFYNTLRFNGTKYSCLVPLWLIPLLANFRCSVLLSDKNALSGEYDTISIASSRGTWTICIGIRSKLFILYCNFLLTERSSITLLSLTFFLNSFHAQIWFSYLNLHLVYTSWIFHLCLNQYPLLRTQWNFSHQKVISFLNRFIWIMALYINLLLI